MKKRTAYSFSILRYTHDITSGEFINVGIVLTANDRSYIYSKINTNYGRAKKIFPTLHAENFKKRLKSIQSLIDSISTKQQASFEFSKDNPLPEVLSYAIASDDSALQWSSMKSGLASDLDNTLDQLYSRYIIKFEKQTTDSKKKDDDVWRDFKSELEKRHLIRFLSPTTISSSDDSVRFDHAWKNGSWHCLEPISFDLSSASSIREKAHKWLGQISSVADGASEDFSVYFLTGKPNDVELQDAYSQALSILKKSDHVHVYEENEASKLSRILEKKIQIHESQANL